LTLTIGKSGHGKDWVAELESICVAAGIPFLGRPVKRGKVLLVILESQRLNLSRIAPLARGLGVSYEELRRDWLHVYPHPLKTDDPQSMAQLAEWIRKFRYDLIVIDNASEIRSSRSQSSENDSTIIGEAMRPLAQLAQLGTINGEQVTDKPPAVVVLHHANADGNARGSTGFLQHADYVIELRRHGNNPESPITLECVVGSRIAGEGLPLTLRFRGLMPAPVVPELVERERAETKVERRDHDRMLALLESAPMSAEALARAFGGSKRDVVRIRRELEADGLVELRDGQWHVVEDAE
jgi:hypothetical protein